MRIWSKPLLVMIRQLILPVLLVFPVVSQAAAPDFQTKILPNGLKIIYQVQTQANTVCARMIVPAGLIYEPPQSRGISQLLEHLILRGSSETAAAKLSKLIDGRWESCNGAVYPNRTEFNLEVLPANLMPALSIYLNFIFHPVLAEPDLPLEKKMVTLEKTFQTDPGNTFFRYLNELTVAQFDDSLKRISRDDLSKYHRQFYRTDLMTVILTGAFKPEEIFKLLETVPRSSEQTLPSADWLFHEPFRNIVLDDYLKGDQYQVMFGFELKDPAPRELAVAKVLPYLLEYETHQYDPVNDRPLDYQISLFNLAGHYFLVFSYCDARDSYSLAADEWHQKNLARYLKYLQAKNYGQFLAKLAKSQLKIRELLTDDPVSLNEYLTLLEFDPAGLTMNDLGPVRSLSSQHFKDFVQKYLIGKDYQKIVVKAFYLNRFSQG